MSGELGSRVWYRFSPEDRRRLRLAGRMALIRAGVDPRHLGEKNFEDEVDKWLESRLESTLEKFLRVARKHNV